MSTTKTAPGPLLTAFDAIAAKGGDPQVIAGQQFQYIMEQIRGNATDAGGPLHRSAR